VKELLEFKDPEWRAVSNQAKDFIRGLFQIDSNKRFSAKTALEHPWMLDAPTSLKDETCGEEMHHDTCEEDAEGKRKRMKVSAPPVPLFSQ